MFCADARPPLPAFCGPEYASSIATVFYELLEFSIGHGGLRDRKRGNLNLVCQLFVIEDEMFGDAPESESAARYFCVAHQVIVGWRKRRVLCRKSHLVNHRNTISLLSSNADYGPGIAQGL